MGLLCMCLACCSVTLVTANGALHVRLDTRVSSLSLLQALCACFVGPPCCCDLCLLGLDLSFCRLSSCAGAVPRRPVGSAFFSCSRLYVLCAFFPPSPFLLVVGEASAGLVLPCCGCCVSCPGHPFAELCGA